MLSRVRIAFALLCFVICLALTGLWVRSAQWHNFLFGDGSHDIFVARLSSTRYFAIVSLRDQMQFCWFDPDPAIDMSQFGWHLAPGENTRFFFEGSPFNKFGIAQTTSGYAAITPHWIPVAASGVLSALLAPSWALSLFTAPYLAIRKVGVPRHFSLFALLSAITILAVVLGAIVLVLKELRPGE